MVLLLLPAAKVRPSGLNTGEYPVSVAIDRPVATSHSLMVLLLLPAAKVRPSGLNTGEYPVSVAIDRRVATSHSLMVSSLLPEAKVRPSGLKATEVTESECPVRVWTKVGLDQVTTRARRERSGIFSMGIPSTPSFIVEPSSALP